MKKKVKFEQGIARLEEVLELMESPETSLEDSLKYYKEGLSLTSELASLLSNAQNEVNELYKNSSGELCEKTFE